MTPLETGGLTRRESRLGEVMTRLYSLPSDTMTEVVDVTGSWMPLLTLLSARSTVALICIGPCSVLGPAWNDTVATP